MKQILQDLRSGDIFLEDVAAPRARSGHLLVETTCSLISAGTERMLVDFARAGYWAKARQQPEKVKQVLDKIRTDGLIPTLQSVQAKLNQPIPMGYCNVGRVVEAGQGVEGFSPGDRVLSNGNHAEVVLVPKNLCARIPDEVTDEQAAFAVLGAIALQGIRLTGPTLGETVAVFGLGLIGLLAVQILRAHGARVIGFDFDGRRVELARGFGATADDLSLGADPVAAAMAQTRSLGVDAVLVTAATQSHELMHQAAEMCRKRGRIVLTGVTGLNLRRSDFYQKELSFQVSCSYGPGRYDPSYEEQGHDYPPALVRWTEQRNFEAVLELMRDGRLTTAPLVSRCVAFDEAKTAYDALAEASTLGILLTYGSGAEQSGDTVMARPPDCAMDRPSAEKVGWHGPETVPQRGPVALTPCPSPKGRGESLLSPVVRHRAPSAVPGAVVCGLIGAGGFAQQKILPALVKAGARLKWVATSKGLSGSVAARRFHIEQSTTDNRQVLADPEVNAVLIATRHASHAGLVAEALRAGKSVFVEKPLCLSAAELQDVADAHQQAHCAGPGEPILMVGFNRRFAPLVELLRARLAGRTSPLAMVFTCNAGAIPADHWTQDPAVGGGRILGEACHFIDLLHFLADQSPITQVAAMRLGSAGPGNLGDTVCINLRMADGSLGQINYFANGPKSFPKERLEVFCEGSVLRIDNFRRLEGFGPRGRNKRCWVQDKGHQQQFRRFLDAVRAGGPSPIPWASLLNTARATLGAVQAVEQGKLIRVASGEG